MKSVGLTGMIKLPLLGGCDTNDVDDVEAGDSSFNANGNGSLMRILPAI